MKNMFNIYYINSEKASEISMLFDNKIVEKITRIKNTELAMAGDSDVSTNAASSKVILIDEFEKASKPVYHFFLQLLEEGKFTDSLGREYDLDKYIIVFTSNMPKEKIGEFLPPELRSRFNYKCAFWPLSTQEKEQYVSFKGEHYLEKIKLECPNVDSSLKLSDIINIDVSRYTNMRDINNEIMRQITGSLYEQIVK